MSPASARAGLKQPSAPEDARKRLVDAALNLFGRNSFEGVSTRTLSQQAGVNLAAIQYYFGGKEGLYLAVARHIDSRIGSLARPVLAKVEADLDARTPTREECFEMVCNLLEVMIKTTLETPDSKKWVGILVREQMEPSPAFDILYEGVMSPMHHCLSRLTGLILGLDPEAEETKIRVFALMGQLIMFHVSRTLVTRTLGWEGYRSSEVESIRAILLENVRALLGMEEKRAT
ncbi:MAG: CerR family C-terminal domain-containing protein [Desulfomonile sp.]|nr:CerR family C-terminal domain-containing protein [Desulfomonile sp.]